jgi:hypothetical protein
VRDAEAQFCPALALGATRLGFSLGYSSLVIFLLAPWTLVSSAHPRRAVRSRTAGVPYPNYGKVRQGEGTPRKITAVLRTRSRRGHTALPGQVRDRNRRFD